MNGAPLPHDGATAAMRLRYDRGHVAAARRWATNRDRPRLSLTSRRAIRQGHAGGRRRYAPADLEEGAFQEGVLRRVARALGEQAPTLAIESWLLRAALVDVFLAEACDDDAQYAWHVLQEHYEAPLVAVARRRGLAEGDADTAATDFLGWLRLPPPGPEARTRIGTFLGSGSLLGWMALVLGRRLARDRKRQAARSLETRSGGDGTMWRDRLPARESASVTPDQDHVVQRVLESLQTAFAALPPRDRLILVWKYVDRVPQHTIAKRLGVGAPRASRLHARALHALAVAGRDALPEVSEGTAADSERDARLAHLLGAWLAREGAALTTNPADARPETT
ncbi:MAG: sigma-70 family RNA polymerase sigma factor [Planctomycetota bacterium]